MTIGYFKSALVKICSILPRGLWIRSVEHICCYYSIVITKSSQCFWYIQICK